VGTLSVAEPLLHLPVRRGPRPQTHACLPHRQVDQWPSAEIVAELTSLTLTLPYVSHRQSRMASPLTFALWLPDEFAAGPDDAFIDGHEFCHVHPLPEGTVHLTLPPVVWDAAMATGWAEPHPAGRIGALPARLATVYAPRNGAELMAVWTLIQESYHFARGLS